MKTCTLLKTANKQNHDFKLKLIRTLWQKTKLVDGRLIIFTIIKPKYTILQAYPTLGLTPMVYKIGIVAGYIVNDYKQNLLLINIL
jgi:hypothetical protein